MSFDLQLAKTMFPALLVSAHRVEDSLEILFLAGPLIGDSVEVTAEFFGSSLCSRHVQKSCIHGS